jgi:parvulin-like peptidyl-prolyl isomerase
MAKSPRLLAVNGGWAENPMQKVDGHPRATCGLRAQQARRTIRHRSITVSAINSLLLMRTTFIAIAGLLGCIALAACNKSPAGLTGATDDKSPVIVQINDSPEYKSAFDRFVKARLSDFNDESAESQTDRDKRLSSLLDAFIRRQLIVQEATSKNIVPTDDEIRLALEEQHTQTSSRDSDPNASTLDANERRVEIFNDLVMRKFYEKNDVLRDVKVTPEEIEAYYNDNPDRYRGTTVVREIRVFEQAEAQKLYSQALAKPDDFGVLAKEHSESPTAANGGLMDYQAQQLPKVLEQAITPLKVGAISKVVQSNYGFHIFKLERRAEAQPLDKVKKEIENKLLSEKNQLLTDQFDQRALGAARIRIQRDKLGFNYSGKLGS